MKNNNLFLINQILKKIDIIIIYWKITLVFNWKKL